MPTIKTSKMALIPSASGDRRLEQVVRQLEPRMLHELIQLHGFDACEDIIAFATPEQLTSVLDLDLWRPSEVGRDESFNTERFGEWVEALVDIGHSMAARIVASLDERIIVAGLSRYLRVFDPGTFEPTESSDDELMDRHAMMSSESSADVLECELGGYLVRAGRFDAWDAIVALLVTLEREHHRCFHAVMSGCRRLSNSRPESDELHVLLPEPEQYIHDLGLERTRRQSRLGYVTPPDARAFLEMARHGQPAVTIVAEYFQELEELPDSLARSRDIAFLANVLVAGCSVQSRPFTPQEAADAAGCICKLGLDRWPAASKADALIVNRSLITAFEIGWSALYRDVILFVADQLIATLDEVQSADREVSLELRALRNALIKHRGAGTPWLARGAADVLARLDMASWISVLGLLDECPVIPAAMTAVLERQATPVSSTAFEFISTPAQLGGVRIFMKALPRLLSR